MKYRTLGRTGLKVSEIGFGAWGIGGWGKLDDPAALDSLSLAFENGVNFFDTAFVYGDGHSEELIGKALGKQRKKIIIASKVPMKTGKWPGLETQPASTQVPADWVIKCTETTLKRLKTDYLDVQQLHAWADRWNNELEWYEALVKLQKQGKVRYFGVSANDWNPYNTVGVIESGRIDTVQVIYNLFEQRPAEKLLPAAIKNKVGIIVRVPLEEGLLTGKYRPGTKFEANDWRGKWMTPERLKEAEPRIKALEKELDEAYRDLPSLALKFCLMHEAVSTVIPGMRRAANVRANIRVSELPDIPKEKLERLYKHKWFHNWKYPW